MKRILSLSQERRQLLFETTAREMKISAVVVEKDFWVCVVLNYLMNESKYKDYFIFKGGTSLSKCYSVINRFSEDIDLILKWDKIGFLDEEVYLKRSKTQDAKFEEIMNEKGGLFIQTDLKEDLEKNLTREINNLQIIGDHKDQRILYVYYPTLYEHNYIEGAVKLEIGPVSAKTPIEKHLIEPYCLKYFNVTQKENFEVDVVSIARTFWEKVLILYSECNRPKEKKTPPRYSRHFYDVYMIYKSSYFNNIIKSKQLFNEVKVFKSKYYRTSWSKIEECRLQNIAIVPSMERLNDIKADYQMMADMFFITPPSFTEIIDGLIELEKTLRKLI